MIILSMLGTGTYQPVQYSWNGRTAQTHRFFQASLREWFPEAELLVCVTSEARAKHGEAIQREVAGVTLIDIPSGRNEEEYWRIFNIVNEKIPQGSDLVLDITHGFRSLPILVLLAISFLRLAKGVSLKHILYGAYEAQIDSIAPVFDLTEFVTMLDWASATSRFLETGDARKFKPLVETKGSKPLNVHLNAAVKELDSLSQALATNRALRSGELARKAREKLLKAKEEKWELRHEPLKLLLPRLEESLTLLSQDGQSSPEDQLKQSFGQVMWLLQNQQFEKALGLSREWMVSFAQWKRQGTWRPVEHRKRGEIEKWLNECAKGEIRPPDDWKAFIEVWKDLRDLRNDLMHFGFREAARAETSIPDEVREKIHRLRTVVYSMGIELPWRGQ